MSCPICVERFNMSSRKIVKCPHCEIKICRACIGTYISDQLEDAHCMNCRKMQSRQFLSQVMTKKFIMTDYKIHREKLLLERQLSRLPGDVPYLENRKKRKALDAERAEIMKEIEERYVLIQRVLRRMQELPTHASIRQSSSSSEEAKPKVRGHCIKDDCNGLIGAGWACLTCEVKVCKSCMKEKADEHVCLESDKQSLAVIRNDSKQCPKCNVRIHKTEGCNQMFCVHCKTAFDWRTLNIIRSGFFHNPYLAEFLAEHGENGGGLTALRAIQNGQNSCVNFADIKNKLMKEGVSETSRIQKRMRGYLLTLNHLLDYEGTLDPESFERQLQELRIRFLSNEISREDFKIESQRVDKKFCKKSETVQIMQMYCHAARDILSLWVKDEKKTHLECEAEIEAVYNYAVKSLRDMQKHYNPHSRPNVAFRRNWYLHL